MSEASSSKNTTGELSARNKPHLPKNKAVRTRTDSVRPYRSLTIELVPTMQEEEAGIFLVSLKSRYHLI